jgi:translocation and assembly module TamB
MRYLLLTACLVVPGVALAQDEDKDWLTALLEENLSGAGRAVVITGFEGALSSRATMQSITIADDQGVWLTLNGVTIDWNRSALLGGRVEVQELTADEIIIARAPDAGETAAAPEAATFAIPELPVSVDIADLGAARIVLGDSLLGEPVEGRLTSNLSLSGDGQGSGQFVLERTDGPVSRIALTAGFDNATRNLTIDLTAEEGQGGLAARAIGLPGAPSVLLAVQGEGPLDAFSADLSLQTDGQDRLAGRISTTGAGDGATAFDADLSGNLAPLFLPDYAAFFGDSISLIAQGTRSADGALTLPRFGLMARTITLDGAVDVAADGSLRRMTAVGRIEDPEGRPVLLPLTTEGETRVGRAGLAVVFDAEVSPDWAGKITVDDLSRPDLTATRLELSGKGRIEPDARGATLTYAARGLVPTDPALARAVGTELSGIVVADWIDAAQELHLPTITMEGAGLSTNAAMTFGRFSEGVVVTATGQVTADDLTRFDALTGLDLGGTGGVTLTRAEANLATGAFDVQAQIAGQALRVGVTEVDTLLRGDSVVTVDAVRDETGIRLRSFDLRAATLSATGRGTVATAGSDITAALDFTDLGALGGPYRGRLTAEAQFTGTPDTGTITLTGTGRDIAVGIAEADNLLRGTSRISLDAALSDGGVDLRSLRVTAANLVADAAGRIDPDNATLAANLQMPDLSVLGRGYGGALTARASFAGSPDRGRITVDGTGTALRAGDAQADRLLAGTSTLSAALRTEGRLIRLDSAEIRNPQVTATATGTLQGQDRVLNLEARLANLAIVLPDFPGALSVRGQAVQSAQGYRLDLSGQGPGGIDATVQGTLSANLARADLAIAGRAQAALANVFIDPTNISGDTRFDLRLNGSLALSSLSGSASLAGGRLTGPDLPFTLTGLTADVGLSGGRATVRASGDISTGGGLSVAGTVGTAAPFPADLSVDLQGFILRDPQLYQTRGNGTITLQGNLTGGATIGGRIALIESEIRIPDTGFGATGSLPTLQHVGEPADVRQTRIFAGLLGSTQDGGGGAGIPFPLNLEISHPNRLFVRGRGLDTEMGGTLTLRGSTAAVIPEGGFRLIRGRLDILGKRLNVAEADLRLEGDFVPYVRILASNSSDGVVSSVQVEGRIDDPEVSFTSVPDLPQEEVLSRLLFGRGLDTLSAFQAAQLAGAVATLAGRGGEGIVAKLRRGFGLDDLDVATGDDGTTSVTAGKYLSQNLYTEVEVDQNGQSNISLNLDVTENLTVRGRVGSDGETGLGLFYERDY